MSHRPAAPPAAASSRALGRRALRRAATLSAVALLGVATNAGAQEPTPTPSPEPTATASPTPAPIPPPANDSRESAPVLQLGAVVRGDTTGATTEPNEPPPSCAYGGTGGSVWYALPKSATPRDLVIELDAAGDLDAVVDVVRRDRSQLTPGDCAPTDRGGRVTLDLTQPKSAELYVRVSPLANSVPGTFTLRAVVPDAPEPPPGRALPARGAAGSLDRVANPADAYAVSLKAGTTYRLRLISGKACVSAGLYRPGTRSFADGDLARSLSCDEYRLFTPGAGEGGRFALQVVAPRNRRGALPYRIAVERAGDDDTAPGLELANDDAVRGALRGTGSDVLDLYRFTVGRRSILDLKLAAADTARFDLRLVGAGGKRIACACGDQGTQRLRSKLKPGRYFVAVRSRNGADGQYTLRRLARTITRLRLGAPKRIAPDATLPLTTTVAPGARGPIQYDLERFDPIAGWQFVRRERRRVVVGRDAWRLEAQPVGRYRVTATYLGSRRFAPAKPRTVEFQVVEPITD